MGHAEEYIQRLNTYRKSILTVSLFVMVLGGLIFTLGVVSRPILRITKPDHIVAVRWMVNVMVAASVMQMVAAAYDIFSGIWKLLYPIYLGITITSLTIFLEIAAVGASLYLYVFSESWANEELIHPWYWVECLKRGSCHKQMLSYIHFFILPQIVLVVITIIFQCMTVMVLTRFVNTMAEHSKILHEAQEKYHDEWEEGHFKFNGESPSPGKGILSKHNNNNNDEDGDQFPPADSTNDDSVMLSPRTPKKVQFAAEEMDNNSTPRRRNTGGNMGRDDIEMVHTTTYEAQVHAVLDLGSPSSILLDDHGYVAGSRVSIDFDKL